LSFFTHIIHRLTNTKGKKIEVQGAGKPKIIDNILFARYGLGMAAE